MAESRSPAEIGAAVVAGLISIAEQRQEVVEQLRRAVAVAVAELDPDCKRETDDDLGWWEENLWARPDGLARFRRAFWDIEQTEAQGKEIADSLVAVLARRPTAVARHHAPTPVEAHRLLTVLSRQRLEQIDRLRKSLRSVKRGLTADTGRAVSAAISGMLDAEERDGQYREKLGRLLSMGELVERAG